MLFGQLVEEILRDVAPLKRPGTTELYFIYLGELKTELGHVDINLFGRKEYMEWMRGFKLRKDRKTFFDYTKFLNIAFRYAYQEKYISHWIKFPHVDGETGPRWRTFDRIEIRTLADAMSDDLLLQFLMSYEMFMRKREVLYVTWDRIDFDRGVVVLRAQDVKTGSKNRKGRDVPISPNVLDLLRHRKKNASTRYVFPSPSGHRPQHDNKTAWALAKKRASIRGGARWHDIRHTALSYAVMVLRLPLAHLSRVAGLSIKTLESVYLHHDIEDIRDITAKMDVYKKAA